ncbi:cobyrinate a,c-diamide synthase [Paenibacillus sp. GCM10012306]|uniref:cobyrinate a,c-diamide synthase n=1 Tax=Paenibacillus sp. GCM10012306 TaxID=3317342 RepID=UPI0036220599
MYSSGSEASGNRQCSRLVIAGTGSSCGKTTVTLGLLRALVRRGLKVQGFKCGPDYIDSAYHAAVTGRPARNLDSWMTPHNYMLASFLHASQDADISIIEGVMGLYDGKEPLGLSGSTAEIALLTASPVLLVVDARSMGRSAAAVVLGFRQLEPEVQIAAVMLNRCGSPSHYRTVKAAVEAACNIPVIGWLGRDAALDIPERHLGLLPAMERGELEPLFDTAADLVAAGIDLARLLEIAAAAPLLANPVVATDQTTDTAAPPLPSHLAVATNHSTTGPAAPPLPSHLAIATNQSATGPAPPQLSAISAVIRPVQDRPDDHTQSDHLRHHKQQFNPVSHTQLDSLSIAPVIAVARDAAFNFYYADNLELLTQAGARLVEFSPLRGDGVPEEADGIYLGGGFPEEFAAVISANRAFMQGLRDAAANDMPLYAECGGYMVLARSLTDRAGADHAMAGIIPAYAKMQEHRAALGYREATALSDCLLLEKGEKLRGHEFHYSTMSYDEAPRQYAYESSGRGGNHLEGYVSGNIMAAYAHIHLASYKPAAIRWVAACRAYQNRKGAQIQEGRNG